MTDHPKPIALVTGGKVDPPIARYRLGLSAPAPHNGYAERPMMLDDSTGDWMKVRDHEAALAAKDARIAELEEANRDAVYLAAAVQERADALRTAIEAKAEEARIIGMSAFAANDPAGPDIREQTLEEIQKLAHALEGSLLALLEKKP